MISRRRLAQIATAAGVTALGLNAGVAASAQESNPVGRIAFVKNGDIWMWSSSSGTSKIIEDGRAMDPTWNPGTNYLMYVRDGGSYSNLIMANTGTGRTRRLTDNESTAEIGSPEYVAGSVWAVDPTWSASGVVCYASNEQSASGEMQVWILNPTAETTYPAAYDGGDGGGVEHLSVDSNGFYAVYTVLVGGWGPGSSTYVAMRDLNMGTTFPMIEGPKGAYDPAISPDGTWIVASIRDENGASDLWLCNREDETLSRLTEDSQASNATWSPDGEWIAYLRWEGSGFELRALKVDLDAREVVGNSKKLIDADDIDSTCGLSWTS